MDWIRVLGFKGAAGLKVQFSREFWLKVLDFKG